MTRFAAPVVSAVFAVTLTGCACCQRSGPAAADKPTTPSESATASTPEASTPAAPDRETPAQPSSPQVPPAPAEPPRRILGLDEGWRLAPGDVATYSATQAGGEVTVRAEGEHLTGGYETKLVMSPLRIYPPQWMLAVKEPAGPATQAITPFDVTASFKADEPVKAVHVSDAGGKHLVEVGQQAEE